MPELTHASLVKQFKADGLSKEEAIELAEDFGYPAPKTVAKRKATQLTNKFFKENSL